MPRKIPETESLAECFSAVMIVGPAGAMDRDELSAYDVLEEPDGELPHPPSWDGVTVRV